MIAEHKAEEDDQPDEPRDEPPAAQNKRKKRDDDDADGEGRLAKKRDMDGPGDKATGTERRKMGLRGGTFTSSYKV